MRALTHKVSVVVVATIVVALLGSGVAQAATAPGVPTIGTAVAGNAQATVSWTAPVSDGGSPITGYVVRSYIGFFQVGSVTFNSPATSQIVTGLTNGTRLTTGAVRAWGANATGQLGNNSTANRSLPVAVSTLG